MMCSAPKVIGANDSAETAERFASRRRPDAAARSLLRRTATIAKTNSASRGTNHRRSALGHGHDGMVTAICRSFGE
jgi:hypothetical protein